jgi:hypothetical protein
VHPNAPSKWYGAHWVLVALAELGYPQPSSFTESLVPLPALALYAAMTGDDRSHMAAERASEFFLAHRLFRRRHGGAVIAPSFLQLHHPCYWHYDILFGLEVLTEAGGHLHDPRCAEALELLRAKHLPDGGFPAEHRY